MGSEGLFSGCSVWHFVGFAALLKVFASSAHGLQGALNQGFQQQKVFLFSRKADPYCMTSQSECLNTADPFYLQIVKMVMWSEERCVLMILLRENYSCLFNTAPPEYMNWYISFKTQKYAPKRHLCTTHPLTPCFSLSLCFIK